MCRDYSHIGISLCRALQIQRAWVRLLYRLDRWTCPRGRGFIDGAGTLRRNAAEPRGGRIAVAYGRDAVDVALFNEFGPVR